MKKRTLLTLILTLSLSAILSGCQKHTDSNQVLITETAEVPSTAETVSPTEPADELSAVQLYQFVKGQGIIKSSYPIFVLDADTPPRLTENDATVRLLTVIQRDRELYAEFRIEDRLATAIEAAQEALAEEAHITDKDTRFPLRGHMKPSWGGANNLLLEGPGIPEHARLPKSVTHSSTDHMIEHDGYILHFMCGIFETQDIDRYRDLTGYSFQIPGFSTPMEFSMEPAPGYGSLEELAAGEGGMDTHDGFSILATATAVEDGILTDLYTYNEKGRRMALQITSPKDNVPVLSHGGKTYPVKSGAGYEGAPDHYRLAEASLGTQNLQFLYDVPLAEQDATLILTVPAVILPSEESSSHITLDIPEDTENLNVEIPFREGELLLRKITRLKEPRESWETDSIGNIVPAEKPAVYLELTTKSSSKDKEIKDVICKRKAEDAVWYTENEWESQKGEFDENQKIEGFYVFYDEGDTEITISFSDPWYHWNQPYEIPLQVKKQ